MQHGVLLLGRRNDTWREAKQLSLTACLCQIPALFSATLLPTVPIRLTWWRSMRTVLFCSHKGGPGKTSLLSHTVSQYAHSHPDRKVLLIDCSVPADVTRQVLGGDHDFKGEENFDKVIDLWTCDHIP